MCFKIVNGENTVLIFFFVPSIAVFLFWKLALIWQALKYKIGNGFTNRYLPINSNALVLLDASKEGSDENISDEGSISLVKARLVIQNYFKVLKCHRLNIRDHSGAVLK